MVRFFDLGTPWRQFLAFENEHVGSRVQHWPQFQAGLLFRSRMPTRCQGGIGFAISVVRMQMIRSARVDWDAWWFSGRQR
jgi:hypothetical protein